MELVRWLPLLIAGGLDMFLVRLGHLFVQSGPDCVGRTHWDGLGFGLAGPQCLPVDSSAMRLLQSTYR